MSPNSIENLKKENAALKAQNKAQQRMILDCEAKIEGLQAQNQRLQAEHQAEKKTWRVLEALMKTMMQGVIEMKKLDLSLEDLQNDLDKLKRVEKKKLERLQIAFARREESVENNENFRREMEAGISTHCIKKEEKW